MKGNPNRYYLLSSISANFEANIGKNRIFNTRFEKFLSVTFDNQLNFNIIFPKFAKQPVINFMHSLVFLTTSVNIKGEYILYLGPKIWKNNHLYLLSKEKLSSGS